MTWSNPSPNETKPKKNWFSKFLKWTAIILVLALLSYYFIGGITYSEGTRSGVITKVSKRGFLFKTYEGELNIGGLNQGDGTIMPLSIFHFSIENPEVYNLVQESEGKKVVLYYKEVFHSFFWQGDTNYFIYKVALVK